MPTVITVDLFLCPFSVSMFNEKAGRKQPENTSRYFPDYGACCGVCTPGTLRKHSQGRCSSMKSGEPVASVLSGAQDGLPQSGPEEKVSVTVPLRPLVPRKHLTLNLASPCNTHTWPSLLNTKNDFSLRSPAVFEGVPREKRRHSWHSEQREPVPLGGSRPVGLSPFFSHLPVQRKLTRHKPRCSVGLCKHV